MKREIKFRVWEQAGERMRYNASIHDNEDPEPLSVGFYTCQSSDSYKQLYPPDECSLMQFTGLYDKNGVEIYEGDVLGANPKLVPTSSRLNSLPSLTSFTQRIQSSSKL